MTSKLAERDSTAGFDLLEVGMYMFNLYSTPSVVKFDRKFIAIIGATGSGKTSILDAGTFALFGATTRTDRNMKMDDIIKPGGYTYVTFSKGGHEYTVKRGRKKNGQSYMELKVDGKTTMEGGVTPIAAEVVRILGMNYDSFVASSIIRQDEMKMFLMKRTSERLVALQNLFGLTIFDKALKAAKEDRDAIDSKILALKSENEGIKRSTINENTIKETIKSRILELREKEAKKKSIDENIDVENAVMAELRQKKEDASGNAATMMSIEKSIADLVDLSKPAIDEVARLQSSMKSLNVERAKLPSIDSLEAAREVAVKAEAILSEINITRAGIDSRESMANEQRDKYAIMLEKYKNGMSIDKFTEIAKEAGAIESHGDFANPESVKAISSIDKKLKAAKVKVVNGVFTEVFSREFQLDESRDDELTGKVDSLQSRLNEIETITGGKKVAGIDRDLANARQLQASIDHVQETLDSRVNQIATIQCNIDEKKSELASMNRSSSGTSIAELIVKKEREISGIVARSNQLAAETGEARGILNSARAQLDQINASKEKIDENNASLADLASEREIVGALVDKILKPSGIPLYAVSTIMSIVSVRASEILNDMTDGGMSLVKFETFEEGRSYGIEIYVDGKLASSFSGGERTQINAAIRLAIAETISEMSSLGAKMRTLFIDEGDMGSLDKDNALPRFLETIAKLAYYSKIIVISHLDGVPEALGGKSIVIEKIAGHSRVVSG